MPTPEYCPNCGSFDLVIHEETAEEYRWCECKTCESTWAEDELPDHTSVVDFDHEDGYEHERPDEQPHPHQGEWF